MKLKIKVTREDIKHGKRQESDSCPIALAVKRELKPSHVNVNDTIEIDDVVFNISRDAKSFIKNFDEGRKVKPSVFIINHERGNTNALDR